MITRKRFIIIAALLFGILFLVVSLLFQPEKNPDKTGTGGSGQPPSGTVILQNIESSSTDRIPFNRFISTKQNLAIRDGLRSILQKQTTPYDFYNASIVDGSVEVNYDTNVISFRVYINETKQTIKATINPVNSELHFYDDSGAVLE